VVVVVIIVGVAAAVLTMVVVVVVTVVGWVGWLDKSRRHDGSPGQGCQCLRESSPILDLHLRPHMSHRRVTSELVSSCGISKLSPPTLLSNCSGIMYCAHVGIDKLTTDPADGHIDRDSVGQPTGLLFDKAESLINPLLTLNVDETAEYISDAVQLLLRHGVTSAHACEDGTWLSLCRLADQHRLPIRIFYSAFYDNGCRDGSIPAPGSTHGEMLSCSRVKFFIDGALGVKTAALSQPYCDSDGSEYGILKMTQVKQWHNI